MSYKIYDRKKRYYGIPTATITKGYLLFFDKATTKILRKENIEAFLILWNKDMLSVRLCAVDKEDEKMFAVRHNKTGTSAIFIKKFIKCIGYYNNVIESRSFPVEWNKEERMFEIELKKEHFIVLN